MDQYLRSADNPMVIYSDSIIREASRALKAAGVPTNGPSSCLASCLAFCLILALPHSALALSNSSFRFGQDSKHSSVTISAGSSLISGERTGIGANQFSAISKADSLYDKPIHLAFEYAEHSRRTTLALGFEYTRVTASENLKTELGLTSDSKLSVSYLDIPITYRLNTFAAGRSGLNFSAGLSLVAMLDIAISSGSVFKSGAGGGDGASGELSNKHLDFGLGFGGEVEIERRVSRNVFLTARAGFRHPFSGVTRPDFGFLLAGLRIYSR